MKRTVVGVLALATLGAVSLSACSNPYGGPSFMSPQSATSPRSAAHRVVPAGSHYKVLYDFSGGSDGADPYSGLTEVNGLLYGTTQSGGGASGCYRGCGTVYSISTTGAENVLHSFAGGSDGLAPDAGLTFVKGLLYGTTGSGGGTGCGGGGCGTVYSISTSGVETVLHSFGPHDGISPWSGLTYVNGTLYGTTLHGVGAGCGGEGCGTVYSITTSGAEKVLHQFGRHGDGAWPAADLVEMKGRLYGTTSEGGGTGCGGAGCGTVYTIGTTGVERVLHGFAGGSDGADPGSLTKVNGTLYGTTQGGGDSSKCPSGCGTVYSITPKGVETVLYRFRGRSDGTDPYGGLIDVSGTLYGTTAVGGGTDCDGGRGCGTIYRVSTSGTEKVLHRFVDDRGFEFPTAPLIFVNGTLYGTTTEGGQGCYGPGCGTVFAQSPLP
jgi:uncharacterized repeat protein (TIGR03803 family)